MTDLTFTRSAGFALLLAAPVLFAGCVSQSEYDALQARSQQQLAAKDAELAASHQQLAAANTQIDRLHGAIKYTVNSDLMFRSGSWEMTQQGQEIISRMAQKLAPDQQSKLVVTGYTDNAPVGSALRRQGVDSNEALSQKRADAVMEYLVSQGVKPDMVTAHAGGEADPVASNDTAQGRAQNRRVELTLASASSS
jgi:chemotaxis protein MotB